MSTHRPVADRSPRYTVFVPTYNRAHTLKAAIQSVDAQSLRCFEILVVDDGSSDGTRELVAGLRTDAPLRYHWQSNAGKHVAYNTAATLANGEFLVLLDSDDYMLPDALAAIDAAWESIPLTERTGFAGVEGLCQRSDGSLHGKPFPEDVFDANYLEMRRRYGVTGEKRHSLRTELLRAFPYPVVAGEHHVRPDFVWKRLAHDYRFRHINQVLQVVDFQPDGLTRNARERRLRNPKGLYLYYRDDLLNHPQYHSRVQRRHVASQYVRYALRCGYSLRAQWREAPDHSLWLAALPRGVQDWILDGFKRWKRRRL